jgi:hypothetical protein
MNKSLIAAAAAVAFATVSFAHAAPQAAGEQADSVQITAPANYKAAPGAFDDYAYAYQLDDGRIIRFTQRVTTFYAQLKGEPKVQIFARAPGVFMTAAGTRIQFRDTGETVAITNLNRMQAAGAAADDGKVYIASR